MTLDPGFVGVVVGSVLTGIVTIGGMWLQGRQASGLDTEKRRDDRRIGRDDFQRENLLALQEVLVEWLRVQSQISRADRMSVAHNSGAVGRKLPEGLAESEMAVGRRLMFLTERVKDDGLRDTLTALRARGADRELRHMKAGYTATLGQLDEAELGDARAGQAAQLQLGELLRAYL